MKEVMSFKAKISKKGKEGYYIKIPASLNHVAGEHHGKWVIVKVYSMDEAYQGEADE